MLFKDACQKAVAYFSQFGESRIACALDAKTHWIFYAGDPKVTEIGSEGIKIEKATGKIEDFYLPDEENFTLLDCSVKMDIAGGFDNAGGYENGNKP